MKLTTHEPHVMVAYPCRWEAVTTIETINGEATVLTFFYVFSSKDEYFAYAYEQWRKMQDMDPRTYRLLITPGTCRDWRNDFEEKLLK